MISYRKDVSDMLAAEDAIVTTIINDLSKLNGANPALGDLDIIKVYYDDGENAIVEIDHDSAGKPERYELIYWKLSAAVLNLKPYHDVDWMRIPRTEDEDVSDEDISENFIRYLNGLIFLGYIVTIE